MKSGVVYAKMPCMVRRSARRRPKITATLDPHLLDAVDAYVAAHPDLDRSAVIDEALRLWQARELERAMEQQFAQPDGVSVGERSAWNAARRAAATRRLRPTT